MKFLIAGLGSIGRRHVKNLLALGQQDILLYRTFQSTLSDEEFAEFPVVKNLKEALAYHPDAVIIANPTAAHLDVAIPAAEAGCHLFLEKPVSHSMERISELQAAIRRGRGKIFVGFQFRFHPGLQKVKNLLLDGAIGRPLSVRAHWGEYLPDWHPWEDYRQSYSARSDLGGGVILTLCHPLDYLVWLFGNVTELWAFADHLSDLIIDVEDTAQIGLKFSNGMLGSVHLDYYQRPPCHFLSIVGSHGTIRWDNEDGTVLLYKFDNSTSKLVTGNWERFPIPNNFERNDLFLAEMRHFLAVLRHEELPKCTLEDGIRALKLALAAHYSSTHGQMVQLN